jgi:hypothetical protein
VGVEKCLDVGRIYPPAGTSAGTSSDRVATKLAGVEEAVNAIGLGKAEPGHDVTDFEG